MGTTLLYISPDGGNSWSLLTTASGTATGLTLGNGVAVTTLMGTDLTVATTLLSTNYTQTADLGPALDAAPLAFANGTLGVAASEPNGTVQFFVSADEGATFVPHGVGSFAAASTSAIFSSIGHTTLGAPYGLPGQVAAVSEGNVAFLLYTSSVNGLVEAFTASSADNGTSWNGPYALSTGIGAVRDPVLAVSPAGYVYAAYRENTQGFWRTGEAVFHLDAKEIGQPETLPLSANDGSYVLETPTLAVDAMERPVYVWEIPQSNGTQLRFSSGYLSPSAALLALQQAVAQLAPGDFNDSQNASLHRAYLENLLSEVQGNLTVPAFQMPPGHRMNALRILETEFYPSVTSVPLVFLCTLLNTTCASGPGHRGQDGRDDGPGDDNGNDTGPAPTVTNVTDLISNFTGTFGANKYLAVYTDWLFEALGVGVLAPDPNDPTVSMDGDTVTANAIPVNPITDQVQISAAFAVTNSFRSGHVPGPHGQSCAVSFTYVNSTVSQNTTLWLNDSTTGSAVGRGHFSTGFHSTGSENIYLTQLKLSDAYSWSLMFSGTYYGEVREYDSCATHKWTNTSEPGPIVGVGPVSGSLPRFAFQLTSPLIVQVATQLNGNTPSLHWNVSEVAVSQASLLSGSGSVVASVQSTQYATEQDLAFPLENPGSYSVQVKSESVPGSVPPGPQVADPGGPASSLPQTLQSSIPIRLFSMFATGSVSGITSTSATLTWDAWTIGGGLLPGQQGSVAVAEVSGGGSLSLDPEAALFTGCIPLGLTYRPCGNEARLSGLTPLSTYAATVGVVVTQGNPSVTYRALATVNFDTPGTFTYAAMDLPYDSLTQEGGGENIQWSGLPPTGFVNGYAAYYPSGNPSQVVNVPILTLQPVPLTSGTYQLNLSVGLSANTTYALTITLNYSQGGQTVGIQSNPGSTFTYLQDTTGDGLADSEKRWGWDVTYQNVLGQFISGIPVKANPSAFATNGLVNDYLAKEFGLNPWKVDTAGSYMLDTWNLTFDLGSNPIPGGVAPWYEDTSNNPTLSASFNPFSASPAPGVAPPRGGNPIGKDWTNLSDMHTAGDNHPWASEVLWDYSSLSYVMSLIGDPAPLAHTPPGHGGGGTGRGGRGGSGGNGGGGGGNEGAGYLRGVTGSWNGHNTLTLWGKLSWGANPLAASTPGDGIQDGARVNPLHEQYLQIYVRSSGLDSCGEGLSQGNGIADQFSVSTSLGGLSEASGFTSPGFDTDSNCHPLKGLPPNSLDVNNYFTVLPVYQGYQFHTVTMQLVANISAQGSGTYSFMGLPLANSKNGCLYSFTVGVDLVNPVHAPFQPGDPSTLNMDCPSGSNPAHLDMGVTAVSAGVRAPTYLWAPSDNSTLSNLPQGLQRYTGEQDFFLVVANVSTTPGCPDSTCPGNIQSWNIPYPGGGHYAITLQGQPTEQMAQFLIPRGQFLASPMGQALLTSPDKAAQGSTDLIAGESIPWLSCYWQGHTVAKSGSSVPLCGAFSETWSQGTTPGTQYAVTTIADQENCASNPGAVNCAAGGVPSNSNLETGVPAPSLEAVITLNLSSTTDLNDLLAGLLDNATGGVNGSFELVTNELPTLGLNGVVMKALVNVTWSTGGVFGWPVSYAQPQPPATPPCSGLGCVWNAVAGVAGALVGIITAVVAPIWNAAVAAAQYFNQLTAGLRAEVAAGAQWVAEATVSALKTVGAALEAALQALLTLVYNEIKALLSDAVSPIQSALTNALATVYQAFNTMLTAVENGGTVTESEAAPFWETMAIPFLIVVAIATATMVALTVVQDVSLGAGFLVGILVTVIVSVALATLAPSTSLMSQFLSGGSAAIYALMGFVNSTASSEHKGPLSNTPNQGGACDYYHTVKAFAEGYGKLTDVIDAVGGTVTVLALAELSALLTVPALRMIATALIMTFAVLGLFFDSAAIFTTGEESLAFSFIGTAWGGLGLLPIIFKKNPAFAIINNAVPAWISKVTDVVDISAFGIGVAQDITTATGVCPGT
jgi:hypothetical protein